MAASTKSAFKKAIKKQFVAVDGILANTATFLYGGETIKLSIPEENKPKKALIFPLKVLFEDDYLAAIHKPAGILVSGNKFMTITNALPQNLQVSKQPDATKPYPVHRLDYATTGILLAGKTSTSIRLLNGLFEDKVINKTYYAINIGEMAKERNINSAIDGKAAETDFQVIASVASPRFGQLNLVKLMPKTGRRHQLRIHLAGMDNPILGDKDYGIEHLILKGKGMYLHAYSLSFKHPITGEKLVLKDELPVRFQKIFPELGEGL
ncbi:MAG: RluA family pseudouridine synthase [Bacteroidota bacterium]